jgi:F-type H+-transporting ATPase subunit c
MSKTRKLFAVSCLTAFVVCFTAPLAFAQTGVDVAAVAAEKKAEAKLEAERAHEIEIAKYSSDVFAYLALAAGLGMGIAAAGGAIGQGKAAAAALEGFARNPSASDKIFTPMILGLALIESLVIYSLVVSFILQGKIAV